MENLKIFIKLIFKKHHQLIYMDLWKCIYEKITLYFLQWKKFREKNVIIYTLANLLNVWLNSQN